MRPILIPLATVSLGAALTPLVKRTRWLTILLIVFAAGVFAFAVWDYARDDGPDGKLLVATASSDVGRSGDVWLKLRAAEGQQLPEQWACDVASFSGDWKATLRKRLILKRDRTWTDEEVVAKFPHDFVGSAREPPPGTYELQCTTLVAADEGAITEDVFARVEFVYG